MVTFRFLRKNSIILKFWSQTFSLSLPDWLPIALNIWYIFSPSVPCMGRKITKTGKMFILWTFIQIIYFCEFYTMFATTRPIPTVDIRRPACPKYWNPVPSYGVSMIMGLFFLRRSDSHFGDKYRFFDQAKFCSFCNPD